MHETLCFSIQSPSPNLDDLPLRCDGCETVSCVVGSFSDHSRIILGSVSDRFRIVNGVSTVFRPCAVDRISLWFATVGSFPQCKWDRKWCWWMSCRWSFEGSLARNAFLRDSRCTKPYVFPDKVRPRTSMIYLCGATGARRSRVWSDHSRIILGSVSDRFRIVNGVSTVFARSSIVFCNSVSADRLVMAASRLLRAVAACVIPLSFPAGSRKSYWSGCMKAATWIC